MGKSRALRVLTLLQADKLLRHSVVYRGDILLTCANPLFLQGLRLERTPYKNTIYVWDFTLPAYHSYAGLALDFSVRLTNGNTFVGSEHEIASGLLSLIHCDGTLRARLLEPLSAAEFLSRHSDFIRYPDYRPLPIVFDIAVTAALCGRVDEARMLIAHLHSRKSLGNNPDLLAWIHIASRAIDDGTIEELVDSIIQRNQRGDT